jgi:hypothetical protein
MEMVDLQIQENVIDITEMIHVLSHHQILFQLYDLQKSDGVMPYPYIQVSGISILQEM